MKIKDKITDELIYTGETRFNLVCQALDKYEEYILRLVNAWRETLTGKYITKRNIDELKEEIKNGDAQ